MPRPVGGVLHFIHEWLCWNIYMHTRQNIAPSTCNCEQGVDGAPVLENSLKYRVKNYFKIKCFFC